MASVLAGEARSSNVRSVGRSVGATRGHPRQNRPETRPHKTEIHEDKRF